MEDEGSEKSYVSLSDSSGILLSDVSDITNESKNSDEVDINDISDDIISTGTFFILLNDINAENIIVDENINIDRNIVLRCDKCFSLKDNVVLCFNSIVDISKYKITFEGGTIIFEEKYIIKRSLGHISFKNTKLILKSEYICHNDIFENVTIKSLCSDTILVFNNKDKVSLSNVSINVKCDVNNIFKIDDVGDIYLSNCKILGKCDANYGIYVTINRLNHEININDTDLGENTINYKKQYVFYEYMLGLFKSTRIPSYVACSNCNFDICKKSNILCKISQPEILREIKLCFGMLNNSFISLKKTILESQYYDINNLNKIINNTYFGVLDKNIINSGNQKYSSIQYNFPQTRKIYCGNVKCQISFTQQDNYYVLPKPIIFKIIDEDEQHLSLSCNNTKSYIIYENISNPITLSYKYENILPVNTLLCSNHDILFNNNKSLEVYISQNLITNINVIKNEKIYDIEYDITASSILGHDNNKFNIRNKDKDCSILVSLDGIEYSYINKEINLTGIFNDNFECISYIDFYVMLRGKDNIKLQYEIDNNIKIEILYNKFIYVSNKPQHIYMKLYLSGDLNNSTYNNFKLKLFSDNIPITYICGNIVLQYKSFIKYKDKYYSDDFTIEGKKNDIINYDVVLPYKIDRELTIKQIIHSNIDNSSNSVSAKFDKLSNCYSFHCNLNDDFVYGERKYIIETELENHNLPKINAILSETNQRGFDIYINNIHILEVLDTENKIQCSNLKFNQIINEMIINNKNVKIKGNIKLKSNFNFDFKLILLGNNNLRLSCDKITYKDRVILEFKDKVSDFYIDLISVKKEVSTMILTSYFAPNIQNKINYKTIEFDNYSIMLIKTPNNFENINCSSINLGNWIIECDDDGNLVIKKRNIDTIKCEDFRIVKQLN